MTSNEAKSILDAYRGDDLECPEFTDALEHLNSDADLATWFERDQAYDQDLSDALADIPLPDTLLESILTSSNEERVIKPDVAEWNDANAMSDEEAKDILAAYRSDCPEDATMKQALKLAEDSAELAEWFDAEQAFDQQMREALKAIAIPEKLRETLLDTEVATKVTPFIQRRPVWLSAAAVFLIAGMLVKYFVFPPAVQFTGEQFSSVDKFRSDMAFYANSRFVLGELTKDLNKAADWLEERDSPVYDQVPEAIVNYEGMGCQTFAWGPQQVSLVCFKNEHEELVHLFVIERADLEDVATPASPLEELLVEQRLETAGWSDDQHVYMIVGSEPDVKIGEIVKRFS